MYYQNMSSKYTKDLINILEMLWSIEKDLNLVRYNETEKKIYYTIAWKTSSMGSCNISDVINSSGFSRSTVYKTIKKFESENLLSLQQSNEDKREFILQLES
ncbi:MAG: MarR family transcriptional regulator [Gammaproteobacteria bacterium]